MKRAAACFVVGGLVLTVGCDFLDPTRVENPRTTPEDLAGSAAPTAALLPGLRAQFARAVASNIVVAEVVSDNYSIQGTGLATELDAPTSLQPTLLNSTGLATGSYWNLQELRALADFVLNEIVPNDRVATDAARAELLYYRGMALVMLGENHAGAPVEPDGPPLSPTGLVGRGIEDLERSLQVGEGGGFELPARAGLARAHRLLGDASAAGLYAQQVLSTDPNFLFLREFDEVGILNQPYLFLVERPLKEMQPLPRLDFLDPKYTGRGSGIPVAKAEEMHLILAEVALATGEFVIGRAHLANAIQIARSRPVTTFLDDDGRLNADLSIRPRSPGIQVRADAESPFRGGLILARPGQSIEFSPISGTSLRADSVLSIPVGNGDDLWHAFHLARQEILFLEGRRMSDLGIRLPMMLREIDANPNIAPGDPGTFVLVPGFLPPQNQMDLFTPASPYDASGNLVTDRVTVSHDLNRILARNRVTAFP